MKAATVHEIKKELATVENGSLIELCLRMAKYKNDNKELLTYLLFESHDEEGYVSAVKSYIDEQLEEVNRSNLYYTKKGLRKILRGVTRFLRYSGNKQTVVEVLIHFCHSTKLSGIPIRRSKVIGNMYDMQMKKINTALATLHEDLQYDYQQQIEKLY
ncbi:MAG: hypothetical protein JXQ96_18715 [Cyclobacteriaceae bacterium]